MSSYRRAQGPGGCYFFTVVTHGRTPWLTETDALHRLRAAFRKVMHKRPFTMDAVVILPDHLHAIWKLPAGDADYSTRWRLIKHHVAISNRGWRWQPRYWEHLLHDDRDWRQHVEYIHYNPVKHGYVDMPRQWPYSSFRRAIERGWYNEDWGATAPADMPTTTGE